MMKSSIQTVQIADENMMKLMTSSKYVTIVDLIIINMTSTILLIIGIALIGISAVKTFLIGNNSLKKKEHRFWDIVGWIGCGIILISALVFRLGQL